jgi:hypothetical protein
MSTTINLKELERRAWRSTFQDGVWDIVLGLQLLAMGLAPLLEEVIPLSDWWIMILWVPIMLVLWVGKKYITVPRMGLVRFGPKRKARLTAMMAIVSISLLLSVILGVLVFTDSIPSKFAGGISVPVITWVALFVAAFSVAAYCTDVNRLYLYGMLFAIPYPVRIILKQIPDLRGFSLLGYFIAGGIVLLVGLVLFVRFLQDYPVMPEPAAEENG